MCNIEIGVEIDNPSDRLAMQKYHFFKNGISPVEFRRCQMRDIQEIMEIDNAVQDREIREQKMRSAMASMR